jgi:hypothetical protein
MKSLFLILAMVLMAGFGYGVQPLRKPFIQIRVDGKPAKSGEILTVKPGQKLMIQVEMEGGRRDYCKFPDIYADIAGTAQILSRGEDGITYQLNGEKAEWKMIKEENQFSSDEFLQIKTNPNQLSTEITVSNNKFSQTYLKSAFKTTWQFTKNGQVNKEENIAEETIYFKVAGESDVWFSTQNIQSKGIKNEQVQEKLKDVQMVCDSIERSFYRLNFVAVQQSIRNLQNAVNTLKSTIDEVTTSNPSYKTKVIFIGLPSDNSFKDLSAFTAIKSSWEALNLLVNDQKTQLGKLSTEPTKENKDELIKVINHFADWQKALPENTFKVFGRYLPELTSELILLPENIRSITEGKTIADYPLAINNLNAFLDLRIQQVPDEIQKISSTQARLQAVRLFDGMLRSYISSIYWAEWKDTRE